jgi:hypothetical protein
VEDFTVILWISITVGIGLLAILAILAKILLSPEMKYHSTAYKLKAKIFFWLGDICRLGSFPWVTWVPKSHKMSFRDVREASFICRPGDIGLHKDDGFLSNLGIPGAFKHAWICVENHMCVEAISEGVIKRDDMAPLVSDYVVILRPRGVGKDSTTEAVARANALVGHPYDVNFKFDFKETEDALFGCRAKRDIQKAVNISSGNYHVAFSCTETVGFCWYHEKKQLNIFRSMYAGREAIIADDFLRMSFNIVYASPSVTSEWALKQGISEEGRFKIFGKEEEKRLKAL